VRAVAAPGVAQVGVGEVALRGDCKIIIIIIIIIIILLQIYFVVRDIRAVAAFDVTQAGVGEAALLPRFDLL
jgi:hypothetical protein